MFHSHGLARLTSGPPQLWEGRLRRRELVRTCPSPRGRLRARPWIPRLATPITSFNPDLTTRERRSDLTLTSITIARVWRAGKRWYLLPRPGLPGGMAQTAKMRKDYFCQPCQQCRACRRRRALASPEDFPSNKHRFMGAENPCVLDE